MKAKVRYVLKKSLYPAFGDANEIPPLIRVRNDLPMSVQKFVLAHEKYHIKDWQRLTKDNKKYFWIWGEIKANLYGFFKHPFGALLCGLMSLSPYRLKFFFQRVREGK